MPSPAKLLNRLEDIAKQLEATGNASALLGLGSVGREQHRLDEFSDLDFFVITKPGYKQQFIDNLSWLTNICPAAYHFQNTVDGHKFLFEDGIFCEFAVFEPDELPAIPFAEGGVIWREPDFDTQVLTPVCKQGRYEKNNDPEWILGEALTNLYVGLSRFCRGEKLSSFKFVQSYALDRVVDLIMLKEHANAAATQDLFMPDRRFESRYPCVADKIKEFCQGYGYCRESATAQLSWLKKNFNVNDFLADEILRLADR